MNDVGQLSTEQYWKWRLYIAEMQSADKDVKIAEGQQRHLMMEIEILKMKAAMFNSQVETLKGKAKIAKDAYDSCKMDLELSLGFSLNNCVIDDTDHVVRKIEE